ncbi:thermonuclease family protein [Halobacillus mangrovi]|uniref:thermonuclease family protein n=1 Tax=Halobacillus mangrovi TaxID=402384 RepID=UPI003D972B0C
MEFLLISLVVAIALLLWFPFAHSRYNHIFIVFLISLFVVGCEAPEEASTNQGEKQEKTSNEKTNEAEVNEESSDNKQRENPLDSLPAATVTRVIDGDTIEIEMNGKTEDVRLLLVDTPETKHPDLPVQPYGPEASQFAEDTLNDKQVRVEYDGPKRDKYGRLLAYLWIDGENFNQMLLEQGLARLAYVFDPPYTHYEIFVKAQTRAANANKNIWSINGYVTESGFNKEESSTESSSEEMKSVYSGPYDPEGADRDCGDFETQHEAQSFFKAAGGPAVDPHQLDGNDNDGVVCESLPN